jgi:hypothetical protein
MASFFGPVSYQVEVTSSAVTIRVDVPDRRPPSELSVHVRLPEEQVVESVMVNGQRHMDFDPIKEVVRVAEPTGDLIIQVDLA